MLFETERTILRRFRREDLEDLQEILGDSQTMEALEPAYTLEKTQTFLETFCMDRQGALAVVEKATGKVIGYLLFCPHEEGIYELGWIFNRRFWRRGLAYESCTALIRYAFSVLGAHKLFAETIDGVRSVGLMQKLGMHPEGIQRSHTQDAHGHWRDVYLYGLLKNEQ